MPPKCLGHGEQRETLQDSQQSPWEGVVWDRSQCPCRAGSLCSAGKRKSQLMFIYHPSPALAWCPGPGICLIPSPGRCSPTSLSLPALQLFLSPHCSLMILQPPLVPLEHPSGSDHFCAHGCKSPGQVLGLSCCSSHSTTSSPCSVHLSRKTQRVLQEGTAPQTSPGWVWLRTHPHGDPWGLPTLISACRFAFLQMVCSEFPTPAKTRQISERNKEKICLARLRNHLVVQEWEQMAMRRTNPQTSALC